MRMGAICVTKIKMMYEEGYYPETVLTQEMEDAISLISNLSLPYLKHEFSCPQQSCLIANVTYLSWILLFQNTKDLLLQNEKLVQAQEEKAQILAAIHTNPPAITEKAILLGA